MIARLSVQEVRLWVNKQRGAGKYMRNRGRGSRFNSRGPNVADKSQVKRKPRKSSSYSACFPLGLQTPESSNRMQQLRGRGNREEGEEQ